MADGADATAHAQRRRGGHASTRVTLTAAAGRGAAESLFHDVCAREVEASASRQVARLRSSCHWRSFKLAARLDGSGARRRSRVVEVAACDGVVVVLLHNGRCVAFCRHTKRLLATLNAGDDDVIRSLFVNDAAAAILTVAVSASDQFHSLRCNSVPLAAVREGQAACTQAMHTLFSDSDEPLTWPGFLELDEANGICLAFFAQSKTFRVLDLATYTPLHAFRHAHIREVKLSLGLLLLVHERQPTHQPLQLMCCKTGAILACHDEPLLSDAKIDLIDQCGGHILIKQEGAPLQVVDVRTGARREVAAFATPHACIFLHTSSNFLALYHDAAGSSGTMLLFSCRGELVTRFADHSLWRVDTSNVFVTNDERTVISHCVSGGTLGLHFSDVWTGQCRFRLLADSHPELRLALSDPTALFFDETQLELSVGARDGSVCVWAAAGAGDEAEGSGAV